MALEKGPKLVAALIEIKISIPPLTEVQSTRHISAVGRSHLELFVFVFGAITRTEYNVRVKWDCQQKHKSHFFWGWQMCFWIFRLQWIWNSLKKNSQFTFKWDATDTKQSHIWIRWQNFGIRKQASANPDEKQNLELIHIKVRYVSISKKSSF